MYISFKKLRLNSHLTSTSMDRPTSLSFRLLAFSCFKLNGHTILFSPSFQSSFLGLHSNSPGGFVEL